MAVEVEGEVETAASLENLVRLSAPEEVQR